MPPPTAHRRLVAVVLFVCAVAAPAEANYLTNGSFEADGPSFAPPATGWTGTGAIVIPTGGYQDGYLYAGVPAAYVGDHYVAFGHVGGLDSISQTFAAPAGRPLTLTYAFAADVGGPNQFVVTFNGVELFNESGIPPTGGAWVLYRFDVVGDAGGTNTLTFAGRHDPEYFGLDGVSVADTAAAVPEPASLVTLAVGAAGLAAARRRLRRA